MTTERGPAVPGTELRERLAETYYRLRWADESWSWLADQHRAPYYELVDALLAEIAASGYSIVATDRFERLRHHAELLFRDFPLAQEAGIGPPDRDKRLLPGDLDPVGPGEGAS